MKPHAKSEQHAVSTMAEDNGLLHWRDQRETVGLITSLPAHNTSPHSVLCKYHSCCHVIEPLRYLIMINYAIKA